MAENSPEPTIEVFVTIPDSSSARLLDKISQKLRNIDISPDVLSWDFLKAEELGRRYRVLVRNFGDWVDTMEVIRYFQARRYYEGNVAAFLVWLSEMKPTGSFTSLPHDLKRFHLNSVEDTREVPCYVADRQGCGGVKMENINDQWDGKVWTFVAFCPVP